MQFIYSYEPMVRALSDKNKDNLVRLGVTEPEKVTEFIIQSYQGVSSVPMVLLNLIQRNDHYIATIAVPIKTKEDSPAMYLVTKHYVRLDSSDGCVKLISC